jgi:hypothetical protein
MSRRAQLALAAAAVLTTVVIAGIIVRRSSAHVVQAGLWFEDVTFALTVLDRKGESFTEAERRQIIREARAACAEAFAAWRLDVVETPGAHYRVRVVQRFQERRMRTLAVAESRVVGPLGGEGAIDFTAIADAALSVAAPGTSRADLVAAIGRGIGRVAAHELAHQILPHLDFHRSTDPASYDFGNVYREAQFFGPMRWDLAGPWLEKALGHRVGSAAGAAAASGW